MISAENKTDAGVNSANLSFINSQEYNQVVSNIFVMDQYPSQCFRHETYSVRKHDSNGHLQSLSPFLPSFFSLSCLIACLVSCDT